MKKPIGITVERSTHKIRVEVECPQCNHSNFECVKEDVEDHKVNCRGCGSTLTYKIDVSKED